MRDILYEAYYTLVTSVLQGLPAIYLLYSVLGPKREGRFLRLSTIIMAYINSISLLLLYVLNLNASIVEIPIFILIYLIYAKICLRGSIIKQILLSITAELLYTPTSFIALYFVTVVLDIPIRLTVEHGPFQFMMYHIMAFIFFITFYGVAKLFKIKKFHFTMKKTELIAMAFSFAMLALIIGLVYRIYKSCGDTLNLDLKIILGVITVAIILFNLALYYFIFKITKQNRIEQENELLRLEQEYQQKHIEDIQHQYEQTQKMRHDYKNNFLVIRSLIADKNDDKAIELINKNLDKINSQKTYIKTNNEVVNAIINIKISEATSYGIKTKFMSISDFDGLDDYDLCNLISNLFDNAIRAVAYTDIEDKTISITLSKRGDYYTVETVNPIEESVLKTNPELISTKSDKVSHGYGMKITREIANKYNGSIDYFEEDKSFHFLVHLLKKN